VLGQRLADIMATTIVLYLFGSCVAFMIIAGDATLKLLQQLADINAHLRPLCSRALAVSAPALAIMLPLSLQRSMGALADASTLAVFILAVTAGSIAVRAVLHMQADGSDMLLRDTGAQGQLASGDGHAAHFERHNSWAAFAAVPIMVFAYQCHVQAVPIFWELERQPALWPRMRTLHHNGPDHHRLPDANCSGATANGASSGGEAADGVEAAAVQSAAEASVSRQQLARDAQSSPLLGRGPGAHIDSTAQASSASKVQGMLAVLVVASCTCTVLYLATGTAGVALFGSATQSNVLNNFDVRDTWMQIVGSCVGLAVALHYPINHHAARSALYDLACRASGHVAAELPPYSHVVMTTVVLFGTSLVAACVVRSLGEVFQLAGGVCGSVIIFVLPGLLLMAECRQMGAPAAPVPTSGSGHTDASSVPLGSSTASHSRRGNHSSYELAANDPDCQPGRDGARSGVLDRLATLHKPPQSRRVLGAILGWSLVAVGLAVVALTVGTTVQKA
jgi:amino acid permease